MPPGSAPTTSILDAFTRANASTLGANWAFPVEPSDVSLKVASNKCVNTHATLFASSRWNTLIAGAQEAYFDVTGSAQNVQIYLGITTAGGLGCWKVVNDQQNNRLRITRFLAGTETILWEGAGQSIPVGGKMWGFIEPVTGAPTQTNVWLKKYAGGTWTTVNQVTDTNRTVPASSYVGIREYKVNGEVDNFGGGAVSAPVSTPKTVSVTVTANPTLSRLQTLARTLSQTVTAAPSLIPGLSFSRTLAQTVTATPTIASLSARVASLLVTVTATPSLARQVGLGTQVANLLATVTVAPTIAKQVVTTTSKAMTVLVTAAPTLTARAGDIFTTSLTAVVTAAGRFAKCRRQTVTALPDVAQVLVTADGEEVFLDPSCCGDGVFAGAAPPTGNGGSSAPGTVAGTATVTATLEATKVR